MAPGPVGRAAQRLQHHRRPLHRLLARRQRQHEPARRTAQRDAEAQLSDVMAYKPEGPHRRHRAGLCGLPSPRCIIGVRDRCPVVRLTTAAENRKPIQASHERAPNGDKALAIPVAATGSRPSALPKTVRHPASARDGVTPVAGASQTTWADGRGHNWSVRTCARMPRPQ